MFQVPEGTLLLAFQIEKSYKMDPDGRHVEELVKHAISHIAKHACYSTERTKPRNGGIDHSLINPTPLPE